MYTHPHATMIESLAIKACMHFWRISRCYNDPEYQQHVLAKDAAEAFGNWQLAHAADMEEYYDAYDRNEDNPFWQTLDAAGACIQGLTIVSGVQNFEELLALCTRLRKWSWCEWTIENSGAIGLDPESEIYLDFERLAER